MNTCTDVLYSDDITDQKHTLVIHTSEKYYLKGECREDIMGWMDKLVVFPDTIKEEMKRKKKLKFRRSDANMLSNRQGKTKSLLLSNENRKHQRSKTHHLVSTENLIDVGRFQESSDKLVSTFQVSQDKLVSTENLIEIEVNSNNNNLVASNPFANIEKVDESKQTRERSRTMSDTSSFNITPHCSFLESFSTPNSELNKTDKSSTPVSVFSNSLNESSFEQVKSRRSFRSDRSNNSFNESNNRIKTIDELPNDQ